MTATSKVPEQPVAPRVEVVRNFFDQPQNYLERKRFDTCVVPRQQRRSWRAPTARKLLISVAGMVPFTLPLLLPDRYLTLLDISSTMLSLARSRVPSDLTGNVKIIQDDFLSVPFEDQSFDVVICMGVLAHVASPSDVIQKVARLLKPGGTLILECTDSQHFVRRLFGLYAGLSALFRTGEYRPNQLTRDDVIGLAETHGLALNGMFRYSWPPPSSQRIFSQDALYRMVRVMFGDAQHSRNQRLGFENIFFLSLPDSSLREVLR